MTQLQPGGTVGVVGVGTMGSGIAQTATLAGHPVVMVDAVPGRADDAVRAVRGQLDRLAARGRLEEPVALAAGSRLTAADDLTALAGASLVIEAAAESLEVKNSLFATLESIVSQDCVLATNTSSLSVSAIAAPLRRPGRLVGMHFFNPAQVMRLVEVISGLDTDPRVAEWVAGTARAWGKVPIQVASTPGFVVNRVARPFYGEALRALEERAGDPATLDAVMRESGGFRMGPLELTDLIGQDVNQAANRSVWEAFGHDPRYAPSLAQRQLVDAGRLGRKSGRGFYVHDGSPPPSPATAAASPAPAEVIVEGDWGPWEPLWERLAGTGIAVRRATDSPAGSATAGPAATAPSPAGAVARMDQVLLVPTSGRTATQEAVERGRPTVVLDLARDPATTTRWAVAASDGCPPAALAEAIGMLQACGAEVTVLDDVPGLLVARTAAMLVNEAADVAGRGVADAAAVDAAMELGANHPQGPLTWGDAIGARRLVELLDTVGAHHGDGRYRACSTLRRAALTGRPLRTL